MKRMAMIAASALLLGRGLAAQDSTQAPAPAAAAPQVNVVEAVVARSVLDRQPQDTGSVFPADVGQLICWTKAEGRGGRATNTWGSTATSRGGAASCRWAERPGAPGAPRRGPAEGPGRWQSGGSPPRRPPPPPPPPRAPPPPPPSPRSQPMGGAAAGASSAPRRDASVREAGAGWTGGETVRPVRTSEPPLWGAAAGSSRTRV